MRNNNVLATGEVLWDIFPDYRRLGGAPFNFAVHVKNFGLQCRFLSRVGRDADGDEIIKKIRDEGFDLSDIQVDDTHPTGTVNVKLDRKGVPLFTIAENVAYDHICFSDTDSLLIDATPGLIYFGTLAQRGPSGFSAIQSFLSRREKGSRALCDINLRPRCYSAKTVIASLEQADILKLNEDEWAEIKKIMGHRGTDDSLARTLFENFNLEIIALTRGDAGAGVITPLGSCSKPAPAVDAIADTVGAGDAFAAVLALGVLRLWQPEKILDMALLFSSRICGIKGAIPADREIYEGMHRTMEAY
ncbi:MAG TPA: PfkB family carbohydrate kinase [Spirochaetota bacterium]|nr:PfkB family carbohydrate kinase [Spirochaetota bacterium]HPI87780.1 PfkB family carbohydrate kinase [Spirochaetota bacterium]HPR47044.1 PfkB family carbohydrate kinase [Spirochaetota bacterium]